MRVDDDRILRSIDTCTRMCDPAKEHISLQTDSKLVVSQYIRVL